MIITRFAPPANLDDFSSIAKQGDAWSEAVSFWFDRATKSTERQVGVGNSQFYNPMKIDTDDPNQKDVITWIGFPKVLQRKHPGDKPAAWKEAEKLMQSRLGSRTIKFRPQDEYCEWHVTREPASKKIIRVTFTCEGPEYWAALAQGYPNDYDGPKTVGAVGDKQKLLLLYRQFISPDVQMADLFQDGQYNPWNKWNTTEGAMHLTHPANTLQAEIQIAADATVLRAKNGVLLTDDDELIRCAEYGVADRASDPHIGGDVNALARKGAAITLVNPVGLYMDNLDTGGWKKPNGSPVGNYWKVLRGTQDMAVRAVYEVPAQEGFTVSDIRIAGEPINFGGQIAEHITMKLTGIACRIGQSHNQPVGCVASVASASRAVAIAQDKTLYTRRQQ